MNEIIKNYAGGKPDVLIFGENHIDPRHRPEQAEYIRKCKPEYVLLEALNNRTPEQTQGIIDTYKFSTMKSLLTNINLPLEDVMTCDLITLIKKYHESNEEYAEFCAKKNDLSVQEVIKLIEPDGVIPMTYEQLLETPFYEFNFNFINLLERTAAEKRLSYEDESLQEKLNFVEMHLMTFGNLCANYFRPHKIYHAVADINGRLVGCDIDKKGACSKELNPVREKTMAKKMIQFSEKRKTDAPIIALIGKNHAKLDSSIYPLLNECKINYCVILQESGISSNSIESKLYTLEVQLG